jgi:NodT family efflux transporter outer membrane factor (OMF) lipoprotein
MQIERFLDLLPRRLASVAVSVALTACTVGTGFSKPDMLAPADWNQFQGGDPLLRQAQTSSLAPLAESWWEAFEDPVLNILEREALVVSPDLQTAALNVVLARIQRSDATTQSQPVASLTAGANRQRQSENGASTRLLDVIGGDHQRLAPLLAEPFSVYQAGVDVSWEPDLWGRVRRSIEAADADVAGQRALLDLARLTLTCDVARYYLELRSTERQIVVLRDEQSAFRERLDILEARVRAGTLDHFDLERQKADLAGLNAQLPGMLAQAATSTNQLSLLLRKRPGQLRETLGPEAQQNALPTLTLGLPSEVAARRPDILSAEARLRKATANIGIAQADLYPSIRLGAHGGLESLRSGELSDWASRNWSIGPSLDLPLFDRGHRLRVVRIRELEQQKAAVEFHETVLRAWQEIDDAVNAYSAEQLQGTELLHRLKSATEAYQLVRARYDAGTIDYTAVIDAQRVSLQARGDMVKSQGRLAQAFVFVNKSIGNVLPSAP